MRGRLRRLLDRLRDWWNGPPGRHAYASALDNRPWYPRTPPVEPGIWGLRAPSYASAPGRPGGERPGAEHHLPGPVETPRSRAGELHRKISERYLGFPTVDAYVEHLFALPAPSIPAAA